MQALAEARDAYHQHWYLPAIRELSLTDAFRSDPKWIARVLLPKISVREASAALGTLEQLGLLRRNESGVLRAVHQQVSTEVEPSSDQIADFHRAMIARATQALADVPRPERDVSSVTLTLDAGGIAAIKRRLQEIEVIATITIHGPIASVCGVADPSGTVIPTSNGVFKPPCQQWTGCGDSSGG